MAKYKIKDDYTTTIAVGGVVGIMNRTFKKGEVFEGSPYFPFPNEKLAEPMVSLIINKSPIQGAEGSVLVPQDHVELVLFSTTNIVIGLAIIGIAFYIYKSN